MGFVNLTFLGMLMLPNVNGIFVKWTKNNWKVSFTLLYGLAGVLEMLWFNVLTNAMNVENHKMEYKKHWYFQWEKNSGYRL